MSPPDSSAPRTPSPTRDGGSPRAGGGASGADEARWVALVAIGDRDAFGEMFLAYAERLAAYAYSLVGAREAAEEIVQDTFCAIWQRREQWVVHGTLTQYLYGSVRNRALDVLKGRRARRRLEAYASRDEVSPAMGRVGRGPLGDVERDEVAARVRAALAALPDQQRAVIRLRWLDRLTHGEIAAVLGISVKTSENHANRAIHRLRELLAALRP
jgi:RNA polymerase sigma-70 factor (ECF subfamily)